MGSISGSGSGGSRFEPNSGWRGRFLLPEEIRDGRRLDEDEVRDGVRDGEREGARVGAGLAVGGGFRDAASCACCSLCRRLSFFSPPLLDPEGRRLLDEPGIALRVEEPRELERDEPRDRSAVRVNLSLVSSTGVGLAERARGTVSDWRLFLTLERRRL